MISLFYFDVFICFTKKTATKFFKAVHMISLCSATRCVIFLPFGFVAYLIIISLTEKNQ